MLPISAFDERRSSYRARLQIMTIKPLDMGGGEALVSRNNARAFDVKVVKADRL